MFDTIHHLQVLSSLPRERRLQGGKKRKRGKRPQQTEKRKSEKFEGKTGETMKRDSPFHRSLNTDLNFCLVRITFLKTV
jgi:hypothetical protein